VDESFAGKVAIVTGGGSGIGRGISLKLAQAGTSVLVADISTDRARSVAAEVEERSAQGIALEVDVSRPDDAERMVRTALERLGRLDFLVNCAGNSHVGPVVELSEEDWNSLLAVHLTGTFLCCRAAVDPLLTSGGRVVNISSSYGFKGRANGAHYSAAKAGVVALTKVLALELAPRANANAIAPGPIDTPRWRAGLSEADYGAKKAARVAEIPLGRMGAPEDIADTALFLLGPASSWITGQVLHVNGGEFLP
jgi:3-oxoacyl-[acyl-carrier protein] reductase